MTTTRAGIYCRISRDAEEEGLGVERQQEDCRALARRSGFDVVDVFTDNDISASTIRRKQRPNYTRMLEEARAGRLDVILAYSNSRLTRRPRELEDLIDLHAATGVLISTVVSGDDDLSTADGRMVARIKSNVDAAEAERTAERVARAQRQIAESGRYIGPRPYGYDFATDDRGVVITGKGKQLEINPIEAEVIREVVDRVLAREAIWSITKDLNGRGITTTTGGQWHTQTLRRMLLRWVHAGYRKHQRYEDGKYVGKEMLHTAGWEAIIDRETHERVVARLTDPSRRTSRSTEPKYLLTSIATCGACGGYLVGTSRFEYKVQGSYVRKDGTRSPDKTRVYPRSYKCPHAGCHKVTRNMEIADDLVERVVVKFLQREGVEVFGGRPSALRASEVRIEELKAQMALLSDDVFGLTKEQFIRQNEKLKQELAAEESRREAATPAESLVEFTSSGAGAAWKKADIEKKRRLLRALGDLVGLSITIDPVGSGAFSGEDTSRYAGIRVERVEQADRDN